MATERNRRAGLPCPFCGVRLSYVVRTTLRGDTIHRRRRCDGCQRQFTTKEGTGNKVTDMSLSILEAIKSVPQPDAVRV